MVNLIHWENLSLSGVLAKMTLRDLKVFYMASVFLCTL